MQKRSLMVVENKRSRKRNKLSREAWGYLTKLKLKSNFCGYLLVEHRYIS
ncbi:MAG: hypothetical protein MK289_20135 [Trichodesmium sp. ALOHA_ZT_67]|nr:hypothetical protein [Trichodesmium sp. ALOHA_ZT_67]